VDLQPQVVSTFSSSTEVHPRTVTNIGLPHSAKRFSDRQSSSTMGSYSNANRSSNGTYESISKKIKTESMEIEDVFSDDDLDDILLAETTSSSSNCNSLGLGVSLNNHDVTHRDNFRTIPATDKSVASRKSNITKINSRVDTSSIDSHMRRDSGNCINELDPTFAKPVVTFLQQPEFADNRLCSEVVSSLFANRGVDESSRTKQTNLTRVNQEMATTRTSLTSNSG